MPGLMTAPSNTSGQLGDFLPNVCGEISQEQRLSDPRKSTESIINPRGHTYGTRGPPGHRPADLPPWTRNGTLAAGRSRPAAPAPLLICPVTTAEEQYYTRGCVVTQPCHVIDDNKAGLTGVMAHQDMYAATGRGHAARQRLSRSTQHWMAQPRQHDSMQSTYMQML